MNISCHFSVYDWMLYMSHFTIWDFLNFSEHSQTWNSGRITESVNLDDYFLLSKSHTLPPYNKQSQLLYPILLCIPIQLEGRLISFLCHSPMQVPVATGLIIITPILIFRQNIKSLEQIVHHPRAIIWKKV